jgi:hypothetical protein
LNPAAAANVTLSWSASPDADATGYKIYFGTASGNYTGNVAVGLVTSVTISNLSPGITYYFAATTLYGASGEESAFSSEASFVTPGCLTMSRRTSCSSPTQLNFPVVPGHWYEVQATTNFQTWTTLQQTGIATSNNWVHITDTQAASFAARYYRLVLH